MHLNDVFDVIALEIQLYDIAQNNVVIITAIDMNWSKLNNLNSQHLKMIFRP